MSDAPPRGPRRSSLPRLFVRLLLGLAIVAGAAAAIVASDIDAYWPLDLREPPGALTQWRIRLLEADAEACRATLRRSEVAFVQAAVVAVSDGCGYDDGVSLTAAGRIQPPPMRCALAAAYSSWRRHVVEPAARRHFGASVVDVRDLGTYSCRDIAGRPGSRSHHAAANAIDVAGFDLSNGRTLTLLRDWTKQGPEARFLREVRDGACGLFGGVISPDWNEAHRDHFHFDLGKADYCR